MQCLKLLLLTLWLILSLHFALRYYFCKYVHTSSLIHVQPPILNSKMYRKKTAQSPGSSKCWIRSRKLKYSTNLSWFNSDNFPSQWNPQHTNRRLQSWKCMDGLKRRRNFLLCAALEWYIPSTTSSHLKSPSLPRRFLGKHQLSAIGEQEREDSKREREEKGGGKLFLRHVALICSPAANENYDLQKVFFLPLSPSPLALHQPLQTTQLEPHTEQV